MSSLLNPSILKSPDVNSSSSGCACTLYTFCGAPCLGCLGFFSTSYAALFAWPPNENGFFSCFICTASFFSAPAF